jgi:replicative DNA helicase
LHAIGERLTAACAAEGAADDTDDLIAAHRRAVDAVPGPIEWDDSGDDHDTLETILNEPDIEADWLIPGWLGREERAVIVAGEGVAKTTLLRQFAVACSAGLNPWNGQRVSDGLRVLFIDAENSRNQSRHNYRWIANQMMRSTMAPGWRSRIVHKTRNDGVDLPGRDEQWFRDVADRTSPDILILGPAYKLMRGDPQKDRDVQDLLDVIDRVRVAHRCAVLVETHAPHGQFQNRDMRPYGSSVWLRWPEVGVGYQRSPECDTPRPNILDCIDWRGAREPRDWPTPIQYGRKEKHDPPWVPSTFGWQPKVQTYYEIPNGDEAA